MMLSDGEIKEALLNGQIVISSDEELYIGPSSLDLHLDNVAKVLPAGTDFNKKVYADKKDEIAGMFVEMNGWDEITINPNEFYILSSKERIKLPANIAGFLQGRSSIARIGLNIHAAGFFDPGFEGTATLEVTNFTTHPIVLPKGIRICQMVFMRTGKSCEVPYDQKKDSKYMGQTGAVLTKIDKEYDHKN